MLTILIDHFVLLSTLILILPWLFWSLHMHTLTAVYHSTWHVDSLTCNTVSTISEHDVRITIRLDCRILAYLVCIWVIYPALPDCMMHDCPPFARLHAACLCRSHFYPLTSKSLGLGHSFHLGSHNAPVHRYSLSLDLTPNLWLGQRASTQKVSHLQ